MLKQHSFKDGTAQLGLADKEEEMKVLECLSNIKEKPIGYIRIVQFTMGGTATERTLETFSNKELVDVQQKDAPAYYDIGEYTYILANM